MKNYRFKIFVFVIMVTFVSCHSKSIQKPEQIGKQVFEILKNINSKSKEDYIGNFSSIEEIRQIVRDENIIKEADTQDEMVSISKEEWKRRIEEDYRRIRVKAKKYGIDWNNIEYSVFPHTLINDGGLNGCQGELFFTYNDKSFKVNVISFWNGEEYRLLIIKKLSVNYDF